MTYRPKRQATIDKWTALFDAYRKTKLTKAKFAEKHGISSAGYFAFMANKLGLCLTHEERQGRGPGPTPAAFKRAAKICQLLNEGKKMNLIGLQFNLTRERVRQIRNKFLRCTWEMK